MVTPEPAQQEQALRSAGDKGMANVDLASEKVVLSIPDGWGPNSKIYDDKGQVCFIIVKNATRARHKEHWAQICDAEFHPLALIRRRPPSVTTVNDTYEFLTYMPNCDGQLFHDRDEDATPVYEYATLKQGLFWSNYWYHSLANETPLVAGPSTLMGQNRNFSWVASCCSFALCCTKWRIKFKNAGKVYLLIDQDKSTMEISQGMDIVASVCIAYAFDRYTRHPFACKEGRVNKVGNDNNNTNEDHTKEE